MTGDLVIKKSHTVKMIDRLGPEFTIEFDIKVNSIDGSSSPKWSKSQGDDYGGEPLYNLFHLTATGDNCCHNGDRVPAVYITNKNRVPHLYILVTMPDHQVGKSSKLVNQEYTAQ